MIKKWLSMKKKWDKYLIVRRFFFLDWFSSHLIRKHWIVIIICCSFFFTLLSLVKSLGWFSVWGFVFIVAVVVFLILIACTSWKWKFCSQPFETIYFEQKPKKIRVIHTSLYVSSPYLMDAQNNLDDGLHVGIDVDKIIVVVCSVYHC